MMDYCAQLFSHITLFPTPRTVAHQGPLSLEFSRQEYWNRLPFPTPGTMEYYSAIKWNILDPVIVRWMSLEPIIQSEVSQKEKSKYRILTHTYGI